MHNLNLASEKISTDYPALKVNSRVGTLINKKEYSLKVLVIGGGELLKSPNTRVINDIMHCLFIRLLNQRSYHFLLNNKSIIPQEY